MKNLVSMHNDAMSLLLGTQKVQPTLTPELVMKMMKPDRPLYQIILLPINKICHMRYKIVERTFASVYPQIS